MLNNFYKILLVKKHCGFYLLAKLPFTNLFRKARKVLREKAVFSVHKDEVSYLLESLPCLRASAVILLEEQIKKLRVFIYRNTFVV